MNTSLPRPGLVRRAVLVIALIVGAASCGALLLLKRGSDSKGPLASPIAPRNPVKRSSTRDLTTAATVKNNGARVGPAARATPRAPTTFVKLPEPTAYSRQLVSALCRLDPPRAPQTQEQAAEWKQNLQQLIAQGPSSVAAICEFLQKNVDQDFGPGNGLGYRSTRGALFDALVQIGGAEGIAGTLQTLQNTADPREIAVLAQNLEKLAPGEHRQEALEAARDALAMAASGKLEGTDVAPLFEVLRSYGDTTVVADLMQAAKQWNYYSAIALAELPDGAGIPALIEMTQDTSRTSPDALEMLAQMSAQYPDARTALVEQARAGKISPKMWPYLTPLLAGDLYHYQGSAFESSVLAQGKRRNSAQVLGNQYFYTAPSTKIQTPEEVTRRMALIDELEAVSSDLAAKNALQHSRGLLGRRQLQTVAVSK